LAIQIIPANTNDHLALLSLLQQPIVPRPPAKYPLQHLCADKAYDSQPLRDQLRKRHFTPHIRYRAFSTHPPPPLEPHRYPARRWVVERTLAWQNDFRSLRVRWAKKSTNWLAFIYFASALILWRMASHQ
jgi:putative transposase